MPHPVLGDMASFEERVIERAVEDELRLLEAMRGASDGPPVGGVRRPAGVADELLRHADPALLGRATAMMPFLSDDEQKRMERRTQRVGLPGLGQ